MAKKFIIEEAFEQLDEIIEELESEKISLTDSMELYKRGIKLLGKCNQAIDKTEKEIIILQEEHHE